ncbi:SPOR domain-containing protein [uncultured Cohaesibacter sp.]|uniref:SPOR domain-containing protein n=1 Tax=uncultured Cohaesibacter sp. TaxID=1002546 RepID=UPI00292F58E2|nr:SPOR domain-containing protein [uncultured Cohaesibacter sp.]
MSDYNDKKPPVPEKDRSDYERYNRTAPQGPGSAIEDPLAELDRIVSGDYGQASSAKDSSAAVSDDDLRVLEQELFRELRGQHGGLGGQKGGLGEAPQVSAANPADRPHPLSQSAMRRDYSAPASAPDVVVSQERPYEPRYSEPQRPRRDPVMSSEPKDLPRATLPSSDKSSSALDDWSSLFENSAPSTPSASPAPSAPTPAAAERAPAERVPAERAPVERAPAPEAESVATSGSYGQLRRMAEDRLRAEAEAAALSKKTEAPEVSQPQRQEQRHEQTYVEPSVAEPSVSAPRERSQSSLNKETARPAPAAYSPVEHVSRYERDEPRHTPDIPSSASWTAQIDEDARSSFGHRYKEEPQAPTSAPAYERSAPAAPEVYQDYSGEVPGQERYDVSSDYSHTRGGAQYSQPAHKTGQEAFSQGYGYRQDAPDVSATSYDERESDPYAAFNQAPDVASQSQGDYADYPADPGYQDASQSGYANEYGMQQPQGAEAYGEESFSTDAAQYGNYGDPNFAQAAGEGTPYFQDEDYTTLDTAAAMAAPQPARKSRKGLFAAIAAACVIIVGGALAWTFGQGSGGDSTETPVVKAETGPVKETPEDPGGKVVPHQDQEVYRHIDGSENDEGATNLMPATEKPYTVANDGRATRVISLSGGESTVSQTAGVDPTNANAVAPKRVRTVVVRPDGSIVTSNEQAGAAQQPAPAPDEPVQATGTPSEQAMMQTYNTNVDGSIREGSDQNVIQLGTGANPSGMPLPKEKPAELQALQAAARSSSPISDPAANTAVPSAIATQTSQPRQGPLLLAPPSSQTPAPATQTYAAPVDSGDGGYTVQVTSQRTPEQAQASYRNIQSQLSSVLGGYEPDIKMADLGARGTYYRVRVGSFADQSGASNFCNQIKAAGGDCLVARK